jgi:hydrogenase maturation protease
MTRIIGIGSPFGADQLAWLAIDHLAGKGLTACELIKLDRPGSRLVQQLQGARRVILLDAVALDEAPGSASHLSPDALQQVMCVTSSHGFGVAQALALASQLGELPTDLHLVGLHTGTDLTQLPPLNTASLEQVVLPLV